MPTQVSDNSEKEDCQKNPRPLKVWRVVEGRKKTEDGKTLKFSIQEIPEDRYDDVLDHMVNVYLRDEAISNYLGMRDDEEAINDFRHAWSFALQQGVGVGAFLVEENNPKPALAGVSLTLIWTEETQRVSKQFKLKSEKYLKMVGHFMSMENEVDTREYYGVENFVMGFGLSVDPRFRRQGICYELLRSREDIGLTYGAYATSSVFSSAASIKAAHKAGWEIHTVRYFKDTKNPDGTEKFPGIPIESCTLMGKKFLPRK